MNRASHYTEWPHTFGLLRRCCPSPCRRRRSATSGDKANACCGMLPRSSGHGAAAYNSHFQECTFAAVWSGAHNDGVDIVIHALACSMLIFLLCASTVLRPSIAVAFNGTIHVPERSGVDPSLVVDRWVCGPSFIGRSGFAHTSRQQQQDMFLLLGRAAGLGSAASQGRI